MLLSHTYFSRMIYGCSTLFSRPEVLCKKVVLNILQNSQENICARVSFLTKLQAVFSYEFCEISKNTFFYRTPLVAASENS